MSESNINYTLNNSLIEAHIATIKTHIAAIERLTSLAIEDEIKAFRSAAANILNISPEILAPLTEEQIKVCSEIASSLSVSPEILAPLTDEQWEVCLEMAYDFSASPEILALLANVENEYIRMVVGENRQTSPETLMLLATAEDEVIRAATGRNPNTPIETITILMSDNSYVRRETKTNPVFRQHIAEQLNLHSHLSEKSIAEAVDAEIAKRFPFEG